MRWLRSGVGVLACLAWAAAWAQADRTQAAREELDRQLKELVGRTPTKVKVTFQGLDEPGFAVEEAEFTLDGRPLPSPLPQSLGREGEHLVYQGEEQPGDHRLEARVTVTDVGNVMMTREAGYKWKLGVARTFSLQRGLEVHVALAPVRDAQATQLKDKFKLTSNATPRMLAVLDDGKMPEPVRPLSPPEPVDAGVGAAPEQSPAEKAAEARRLAAEEKLRKAEEARAAKAAAAEEKKRKAEEARAAKAAAAEEKKRLAAERRQAALDAKAGRVASSEEKAALAPKLPTAGEGEAGAVAASPPEADAGAPPTASAAEEPAEAPKLRPAAAEPAGPPGASEPPWAILGVAAGAAVLVLLVLVARRRSNPRDPGA